MSLEEGPITKIDEKLYDDYRNNVTLLLISLQDDSSENNTWLNTMIEDHKVIRKQ